MSFLRALIVASLLVALLPWGAYLRAMPIHPGGSAAGQEVQQVGVDTETAQAPLIKCRKGLPTSPCSPDLKALVSVSDGDRSELAETPTFALSDRVAAGLSSPPALPPPRLL